MSYYFALNGTDYSMYVNKLVVGTEHNYKSMTTAAGRTLVKYINSKRVIEVGFVALDDVVMMKLINDINKFNVSISFRDPETNAITTEIPCIIPNNIIEYYTIQAGKVSYKAFSIQIKEL
jgi:hypothetical protein